MLKKILDVITIFLEGAMNVSQRYAETEVSGLDQIELESRALIKTASSLNQIKEHWEQDQGNLAEALEKNRKLWTLIASAMSDDSSPQPAELRKNLLNLAMFVFKRTMEVLVNPSPESLDILISINMNIARGLAEHEQSPQE